MKIYLILIYKSSNFINEYQEKVIEENGVDNNKEGRFNNQNTATWVPEYFNLLFYYSKAYIAHHCCSVFKPQPVWFYTINRQSLGTFKKSLKAALVLLMPPLKQASAIIRVHFPAGVVDLFIKSAKYS